MAISIGHVKFKGGKSFSFCSKDELLEGLKIQESDTLSGYIELFGQNSSIVFNMQDKKSLVDAIRCSVDLNLKPINVHEKSL